MVRYTFIRWVGGKEWLWKHIKPYLISDNHPIYIEPFLGGGAIAIHYLKWCRKHNVNKKFILSDTNEALINTYIKIRDDVDELIERLETLCNTPINEKLYYACRDEFNKISKDSVRSAALFIFLNGRSYGGIWRVNKHDNFNVSFDKTRTIDVFSADQLRDLRDLFQDVEFRCCAFNEVRENGIIYLDPPYINVYRKYSLNPPTNQDLQRFIEDHPDSDVLISNNMHYTPPTNATLLYKTAIPERLSSKLDARRGEYLYRIPDKN